MENQLEKFGQNSFMDNVVKNDDILKDMCGIIQSSQKAAYQAVNTLLVQRNWLIGYRRMSQEQLAEKLGVSRQAVTKWETDTGIPDIENIMAISALFDISIDELFSNEKGSKKPVQGLHCRGSCRQCCCPW